MVELADTPDLGSGAVRHESSSLSWGTILISVMIVFYKNYKRTDRTLLSIQSVRHLFPDIDIRCLFLYDESADEYIYEFEKEIELLKKLKVKLFFDKKKWNFSDRKAAGSSLNGYYFTEGINKIQSITKDCEKVLILDEDSFFTNGLTIEFLLKNNFDLACCYWMAPPNMVSYTERPMLEMNGSILAINSKKLNPIFPIVEKEEYIEILLGHELFGKVRSMEDSIVLEIPTRYYDNYFGDGVHTNDIEVIKSELQKANIPYE